MTYFLAALLLLLKVVGILLALLMGLAVLLISLPLRARGSLALAAKGLLEGVLDDDARLLFRTERIAGNEGTPDRGTEAGLQDEPERDRPVVPVDLGYEVSLETLYGAAALETSSAGGLRVRALGMSFRTAERRKEKPAEPVAAKIEEESAERGGRKMPGWLKKRSRDQKRRRGISLAELRRYLAPGVREKTVAFLKDLFGSVRFEGDLDVELGLPDRGATGMMFAAYWALGGPRAFGGVRLRPNFTGEVVDARGTAQLTVVPIKAGWIAGRYLLSREIRPLWRKKKGPKRRAAGNRAKPVLQESDG